MTNFLKLLCVFCMAIVVTLSATAHARTFKLGYNHTDDHPTGKAMILFAQLVENYTNGRHKIRLYNAGQLGDERKMLEQVQSGLLDITKTATILLTTYNNEYSVLVMPFIFRDLEHFIAVTEGEIGAHLLKSLVNKNMRGLTFLYDEPRSIYTTKKSVETPQDIRHLKIRAMNSPDAIRPLQLFGATPTPITWSEVYTSLQQGIVDGAVGGPSALTLYQHGDFAKFFSNDQHVIYPGAIVMNERSWNRLSSEDQEAFMRAAHKASEQQRNDFLILQNQALEDMKTMGVTIVENPDRDAFRAKVQPMYDDVNRDMKMKNLIMQIEDLK